MKVLICGMAEINPDRVSKNIMRVLRAEYSHVAVIFWDKEGTKKIFHAIGGGVQTILAEPYYKTHKDIWAKTVDLDCSHDDFERLTLLWDNIPYSKAQFVNCFLDEVGLGFLEFTTNGIEEMFCSELVMRVLDKWSIYKARENMDSVDPTEIKEILGVSE